MNRPINVLTFVRGDFFVQFNRIYLCDMDFRKLLHALTLWALKFLFQKSLLVTIQTFIAYLKCGKLVSKKLVPDGAIEVKFASDQTFDHFDQLAVSLVNFLYFLQKWLTF
jgi:hypothetical protein